MAAILDIFKICGTSELDTSFVWQKDRNWLMCNRSDLKLPLHLKLAILATFC